MSLWMSCRLSSELNCASCARNSPSGCGSSGFWCCSCVTSSFKKASRPSALVPAGAVAGVVAAVVVVVPVTASIAIGYSLFLFWARVGHHESNARQLVHVLELDSLLERAMLHQRSVAQPLEHEPASSGQLPQAPALVD